jgi:cytochrome c oxidase subunit 2
VRTLRGSHLGGTLARAALPVLLATACQGSQNVLDPAGPPNRTIARLFWAMLLVSAAIWVAVIVAAFGAAIARRRTTREDLEPVIGVPNEAHRRHAGIVTILVAATAFILLLFLVYDFTVGRALAQRPVRTLTMELIGHQWWWEVQYVDPDPSKIVVDANELHIPAGEPVQVKLSSRDVIHSFWVPNIIGKRDLIPGYTSSLFLNADRPGVYRAQCAEFCGAEHAKMALTGVLHPRADFAAWLTKARAPAAAPNASSAKEGERVFLARPCSSCHAITGAPAYATIGPNLTHLASRRTLGAGTLANTRANLAGWIVDPQSIKPGVRMPSNQLEPKDLRALLDYLETLK